MRQNNEFNLDIAIKMRGGIQKGFVNIALKADGTWVRIPVIVVGGVEDGPVLLVDAGVHGDEHEAIEAVINVANKLDINKLKGTFVGVPAVNLDAFSAGQRTSPIDLSNGDLNRSYPGYDDSYITPFIAKTYVENFIKKANYNITFHGGGNTLYLEPLSCYQDSGDKNGEISLGMAEAFGGKILWRCKPGLIKTHGGVQDDIAQALGVPCITPEVGGQCIRHHERKKHVEICEKGILNVMRYLKMLDEEVEITSGQIHIDLTYIHSKVGGIHHPIKRPMEDVKEGEVLATVSNLFGDTVGEIIAPFDGIVVGYYVYPMIQPGTWSYLYGKRIK